MLEISDQSFGLWRAEMHLSRYEGRGFSSRCMTDLDIRPSGYKNDLEDG